MLLVENNKTWTNIVETVDADNITLLKTMSPETGHQLSNGLLRLPMRVVALGVKRIYVDLPVWITTRVIETLPPVSTHVVTNLRVARHIANL